MKPSFDPASVHRTVLANGLVVIINPDRSAPVAAVNTYVRAGYFDEPDAVVGISHVLEHMFFKGTSTLGPGEIAKRTKAAGGYLNAHTIYDHTSYYAVLPADGFDDGLRIQADAYASSVIDADELARELEVIIQEVKRKEDNPGAVATETLYKLLHDTHRIRRWRIGRPSVLRTFTRDDVLRFYRSHYTPSNTVLSVSGDVDVDHTLALVDELYGSLPAGNVTRDEGPAEEGSGGFRYEGLTGDVSTSHVELGWRSVAPLHADAPVLDAAASVLAAGRASRLYRAVREPGLAASVGAYDYGARDVGMFVVSLAGEPDRARDAAREAWAQVAAMRDGDVTDDEIARVRQLFSARWTRRLETAEGRAAHLAEWETLGGWQRADEFRDAFLASDRDGIVDVARRHLSHDAAAVVAYTPEGATLAASAEELRAVLDAPATRVAPVANPELPAAPKPAVVRRETVTGGVQVFRTGSDVPVLVRSIPGARMTHLGVYASTGSAWDDASRAGLTALTVRSAARATRRHTAVELAAAAELLGGGISGSTSSESLGWSVSVPPQSLGSALSLLAEVATDAALPDDIVASERAAMLADANAVRDDMYRYPMRLAAEAAFGEHPYAVPAGGTVETLEKLDAGAVRTRYDALRSGSPWVIGIAGDVDAADVAAQAASAFAGLAAGTVAPLPAFAWPAGSESGSAERDKAQTALALMFPGPRRNDPSRFAAHVLGAIASGLGGRFFDELRDRRSLAYTVHAFSSEHRVAGAFVAYIATSPEREYEARDGLLTEFARLRDEPVTDDELHRALRYLTGMHAIRQERGGAQLADMLDAWMMGSGLGELDEYVPQIRAVTADDILRLAREWFDPSRVAQGIVRGTRVPVVA